MTKKSTGDYEVIWPRGERKQALRPLAKRLDTLAGKTVAQLWDYLFAGDEVFATLEETLRAQYPGVPTTNPAKRSLPGSLKFTPTPKSSRVGAWPALTNSSSNSI